MPRVRLCFSENSSKGESKAQTLLRQPTGATSENPASLPDGKAASVSGRLAAFWHPIDADAWRAPSFAPGADAARGARAELEERALRGRLRAGWTRWSAEASVRPAAAWIEDVQHALIGPRGVCSHGWRRWERMGDFRPSHMLERVWLHAWIGTRLAAVSYTHLTLPTILLV